MLRIVEKKRKIRFGICYMLFVAVILFIVLTVVQKKESLEYKSIQLENVISEIPTEIIESEEIILNKSENRFEIESKDKSCYICGVELQSVDESNVPYIEDSDGLLMLKNANTSGQVIDGIRSGTGLLEDIESQGSIKKPSYTMYYFSSTEKLKEKDYQVYIMFLIQGDVRYMQINVLDEEHALSDMQKKHMRLFTYCY